MASPRSLYALTILCALLSFHPAVAKSDPSTGRCRAIWIGEICGTTEVAIDIISTEPRFVMAGQVPCDLQWVSILDAKRFTRMYLPRSYAHLYQNYDVVIFHDFSPEVLPLGFLDWFRRAIGEGLGLCLIEFAYRSATYAGMDQWPQLEFYEVFPASFAFNQVEAMNGRQYLTVVQEGPLLAIPELETRNMNWGAHGDILPRAGSTVWAVFRGRGTAAVVSRRYDNGTVVQAGSGWDTVPDETKRWEYFPDYIYNHLTFVTGLQFPPDLELVHGARMAFRSFAADRRMAISVLAFIEKFGANPYTFERKIGDLSTRYKEAEQLYIDLRIDESLEIMDNLLARMGAIGNEMMRARDRALLWVYVSEYLVVAATSMACGFSLWTLMVRRRLYRESTSSKGRPRHREW